MTPVIVANLFIAVFISGHLLKLDTSLFKCDNPAGASACIYTIFDHIMDNPQNVNVNYSNLRTGRTGTALLTIGVYLIFVALTILIPDKSGEGRVGEAFDGNIWEFYTWKRSNMIFCSAFLAFMGLSII